MIINFILCIICLLVLPTNTETGKEVSNSKVKYLDGHIDTVIDANTWQHRALDTNLSPDPSDPSQDRSGTASLLRYEEYETESLIRDVLGFEPSTSSVDGGENVASFKGSRIRRGVGADEEGCVEPGNWLALVSYEGLPLRIPCNPCEPVYGVSWTKESNRGEKDVRFDSPEAENHRLILGGDSAIYILKTNQKDKGVYRCRGDDIIISTYLVEIKTPGDIHVIRPPEVGGDGDGQGLGNYLEDGRLVMYTNWVEWGSCSECTKGRTHGERARMGYCYAMSRVDKFPLGLPCSSPEIPAKERKKYKRRPDEKMIEACQEQCPKENQIASNLTIFDQLLGKGRLQEEPLKVHEGQYLLLICPGLEIDSAVTWHNGSRLIDAKYLASTGGRVRIDIYDGLQIFHLHKRDGQPYHCYVDGKRRATFRLYVTKKLVDPNEIVESFIYIGILVGIYTMVFLIIMLAKHNIRRRQRIKKVTI